MVSKGEEVEFSLYNRVKNAEYARQKQDQTVRHITTDLADLRRSNAQSLKAQMLDQTKAEVDLDQKLQREQAVLAKVSKQSRFYKCTWS